MLAAVDSVGQSLAETGDPARVREQLRLVQDLVARLPHKYLPAATRDEIKAAGRAMMGEGRSKEEMKALQILLLDLFDRFAQTGVVAGSPLRGHDFSSDHGGQVADIGLAVCFPPGRLEHIRELLVPIGLALHAEASTRAAMDRLTWFPFSLILTAFPIEAPARFLEAVRAPTSLCRSAGVVIAVGDDQLKSAQVYEGRGANRVVAMSTAAERLPQIHAELSMVSERIHCRIPVQVAVDGGRRSEMWRCENMSGSGMLLRTDADLAKGRQVELHFTVPGDDLPIHASAEVVRSTTFGREDFQGLGVRFLSFNGDGQHRLELYLRRLAGARSPDEVSPVD